MNSGIYEIVNLINHKRYVGSSINISLREREHFNDLKNNNHHSTYLQRSYNKYGYKNFIFNIIELCPSNREVLLSKEQQHIDIKSEYNMCKIAGSSLGYASNMRNIVLMDISGNVIKEFNTAADAARFISCDPSTIIQVCKERISSVRGFIVIYKEKHTEQYIQHRIDIYKKARFNKKFGHLKTNQKAVLQYSKDNKFIAEYESMAAAGRSLNKNGNQICSCCHGRKSHAYGFIWKLKENKYD